MTWVRIDDLAPLHPKILDVGPEAAWLWVAGLAHANRHHTDGSIAKGHLGALFPWDGWTTSKVGRLAASLVARGLWIDAGDRYEIHQYAEYQEEALKENAESRKVAARERKRLQREREKQRKRETGDGCHAVTPRDNECDAKRDSHAGRHVTSRVTDSGTQPPMSQPPVPSRPVPSPSSTRTEDTHVENRAAPAARREPRGKPRDAAVAAEVAEVFEHWRAALGKTAAAKLDGKRRKRIEWALAAYGIDSVRRCIDGYASSSWHRGQNDRGRAYDDLELFLRDAKHVEAGLAMADAPPKLVGRLPPARISEESARQSMAAFEDFFGPIGEVANG